MPNERKAAIVTGAASGMGRAMALALSDAGFDVVAVDRNAAGLGSLPAPIRGFAADLSQAASFDAIVAEAINVFALNLKALLLAAPAGPRATMGLDPGLRTGVKVAIVDATGKVVDTATIYPHQPRNDWDGSLHTSSLKAVRDSKPIVWDEPLAIEFRFLYNGHHKAVEMIAILAGNLLRGHDQNGNLSRLRLASRGT